MVGVRRREGRGRITSPSNMAAATTLTTRRRRRILFPTTGNSSECECFLPSLHPCVERTRTLLRERGREGESNAHCVMIGIYWITLFYGPSQGPRPWTSECLLRRSSNLDVGYVGFFSRNLLRLETSMVPPILVTMRQSSVSPAHALPPLFFFLCG